MLDLPRPPLRVALLGAGRVGTAVCELLRRRGHAIEVVWSRTRTSADRAADFLGTRAGDVGDVSNASFVLIGTADDAIGEIARSIGPLVVPGTVIAHLAGSLGTRALDEAVAEDVHPLALHPVQTCPDVESALRRIPGSAWGITCAPDLREWARRLVSEELRGLPVIVDEADRPLWHAASVVTANGISALLALAESLLHASTPTPAADVLGPLARGALSNALARGGAATLTGPAVRGESATVGRHLDALTRSAPELLASYRRVSDMVLGEASRTGRLARDAEARLRDVLGTT